MMFAFLAVLAAPTPQIIASEPVEQVAPVDPATLAEAVRLLDAEGFEQEAVRSSELGLEAGMAAMTEQIQKTLGDSVPADFLAQLRQIMRDHSMATLKAKLPAITADAARLYAREFTRGELVRLRQLSADPVMVKARARNKVLAPRLMMIGIKAMREAQPELDAKVKRLIADYLARTKAKPTS